VLDWGIEVREASSPGELRTEDHRAHAAAWTWGAVGVVAAFVAISCWWLSRDHGVPFADAASHLYTVVALWERFGDGDWGAVWERTHYYPPLTFLVGLAGSAVGGLGADMPIVAQNLVHIPLLALGCFGTARLVAGPQAGFLAVVFALGAPLLIEQAHVFMIDLPVAAMVALSVWLILRTERFSRVGASALAGVAVGLGLESKEQYPLFVAGLLVVFVLRERGWRNWRGIAAFAATALLVGAPWYLINLEHLSQYVAAAGANANLPPRGKPPLVSISNLGWYGWAILNALLFAPLFAYAAIGTVRAALETVRRRTRGLVPTGGRTLLPELLAGLFVGWLGITLTPHHDMRYTLSLIVYLAVLGTIWIVDLRQVARRLAIAGLVLATVLTTLGMSFGLGPDVRVVLGGERVVTDVSFGIPAPNEITLHADEDFNVSAPRTGDDVQALFEAIHRDGATGVAWSSDTAPLGDPVFDQQGVQLFARFAGLTVPDADGASIVRGAPAPGEVEKPARESWQRTRWDLTEPGHVFVIRAPAYGSEAPCMPLHDGTGLWLRRGDPEAPGAEPYCPDWG
jgi:4-amino-4-deoxy-L-arabinose transferase-like glycosyltransferase